MATLPHATGGLTVVCVLHDSAGVVRALLASIQRHLPASTQVVVVDSGSSDDGAAVARAHGAEVVELGSNPGFGAANVVGVDRARGDVCLLLNPDVELLDDGLARLAERARAHDALHVPRLLRADGTVQDSAHPLPGTRRALLPALVPPALLGARGRLAAELWRAERPRAVGWAVGAAVVARTATLRELGPFDPRLFLFNEDLELCLRARATGRPTVLDPTVAVRHHEAHAARELGDRRLDLEAATRRRVVGQALGRRALVRDDRALALTFATRAGARRLLRRDADRPTAQAAALRRARALPPPLGVVLVSHTGQLGGGERCLLDLVDALEPPVRLAACVPDGPLADALRARGLHVVALRGTRAALGSPLGALRGIGVLLADGVRVARTVRRERAALTYAVAVRAGLVTTIARRLSSARAVCFVQDLLPEGRGPELVRAALRHGIDRRQACSALVAERLRAPADVVFESLDVHRFDPARRSRVQARAETGMGPEPTLVLVGQITPWKGQLEAVRALALVRERVPDARLVLVGALAVVPGDRRWDNAGHLEAVRAEAARLGLADAVAWWGPRDDVPAIMRAADVVLMPSWAEPFGRVTIEAMAMEAPVVATRVGGPAEHVVDGVTGVLVDPHDPEDIARAASALLLDPARARRMGEAGSLAARSRFGRDPATGDDRFSAAVWASWQAALAEG